MSCLTFEACWEKDGLIEDYNDDLDMFPNVVLADSNLDEIRRMKLTSWKEDFEGRLYSIGISHMEVSIEETDTMDENLGSLLKGMPLVGGHSF